MRIIAGLVVLAAIAGVVVLSLRKPAPEPTGAEEKASGEPSRISHDDKGRTIIKLDHETQQRAGLVLARPAAARLNPELKGYGRVLDPTPLTALMAELATAQAGYTASSNEWVRLKSLADQGNASARTLQTAQAAAMRDEIAVQSARDHIALAWGKGVAAQKNLPEFVSTLITHEVALVRLDLHAGQALASSPVKARIASLAGTWAEAEFLEPAANVDPQTLGRGWIFLLKPNSSRLLPGEAVTGYLQLPGEPLTGVIIPSSAIVRTEGAGWVYVQNGNGESFTRTGISLDRPLEKGWFVSEGIQTNDTIVVTGAQTLLSEELKSSLKAD